jgi:hypothetical protein
MNERDYLIVMKNEANMFLTYLSTCVPAFSCFMHREMFVTTLVWLHRTTVDKMRIVLRTIVNYCKVIDTCLDYTGV